MSVFFHGACLPSPILGWSGDYFELSCLKVMLFRLKLPVLKARWGLVIGTGFLLSFCRGISFFKLGLFRLFKPRVCKQLFHYMKVRTLKKINSDQM